MTSVSAEIWIDTPPEQVWYAYTNATALREWLCDNASVTPRPGGHLYLWWNGEFYSSGHYISMEKNEMLSFRWFSGTDPAPTEATVTLVAKDEGTLVIMRHDVPDDDERWDELVETYQTHWAVSLENLKSVLEDGLDLRVVNRPMLGIIPSDFSPEIAENLGVPVAEGVRIAGVGPGTGAEKTGLRADDVIVRINDQPVTHEQGSLALILEGKKAGDTVKVVFYRGKDKYSVTMELSRRPMPDVPTEPADLADAVRKAHDDVLKELDALFVEASDEQAKKRPSASEWSALETLAHLLQNEDSLRTFMDDLVGGYERWADDWGGNMDPHIRALTDAYPTISAMLDEIKRNVAANVAFASYLPSSFLKRKASYHRLGWSLLQNPSHIRGHFEQIQNALAAAK